MAVTSKREFIKEFLDTSLKKIVTSNYIANCKRLYNLNMVAAPYYHIALGKDDYDYFDNEISFIDYRRNGNIQFQIQLETILTNSDEHSFEKAVDRISDTVEFLLMEANSNARTNVNNSYTMTLGTTNKATLLVRSVKITGSGVNLFTDSQKTAGAIVNGEVKYSITTI
jgi:hypothetical protein